MKTFVEPKRAKSKKVKAESKKSQLNQARAFGTLKSLIKSSKGLGQSKVNYGQHHLKNCSKRSQDQCVTGGQARGAANAFREAAQNGVGPCDKRLEKEDGGPVCYGGPTAWGRQSQPGAASSSLPGREQYNF